VERYDQTQDSLSNVFAYTTLWFPFVQASLDISTVVGIVGIDMVMIW